MYIIHTTTYEHIESILKNGLLTSYSDRKTDNYIWFNLIYTTDKINGQNLGCYDDNCTLVLDVNHIVVDILYNYYNNIPVEYDFEVAEKDTAFRHNDGAIIKISTKNFYRRNINNKEIKQTITDMYFLQNYDDLNKINFWKEIEKGGVGECVLHTHYKLYFPFKKYLKGIFTSIFICNNINELLHKHKYENVKLYCKDLDNNYFEDFEIYKETCKYLSDNDLDKVRSILSKYNLPISTTKENNCIMLYIFFELFCDRD